MNEKKVLVVEDEEPIRKLYQRFFDEKGYRVRMAPSAEEALEILKDNEFQLMFLDLNLPGIDGLELCRRIREGFPVAWICAVTGYGSIFELADCRAAGFDDYFTKPIDFEKLLEAAQEAFAKLNIGKKL